MPPDTKFIEDLRKKNISIRKNIITPAITTTTTKFACLMGLSKDLYFTMSKMKQLLPYIPHIPHSQ